MDGQTTWHLAYELMEQKYALKEKPLLKDTFYLADSTA